ncbi:MAG: hypothetical protein OEV91_08480 [Desulfobulbaceae bacterium]|nr:hypothetical protein [Desulfobulbaceae bacterium]
MARATADKMGGGGRAWLVGVFGVFLALYGLGGVTAAKVSGPCSNCHTMHNSQNGQPVVAAGAQPTLLNATCVGCHSSATAETKITANGSVIPIVYNTVEPTTPLAGGNFYWVTKNSNRGHNCLSIPGMVNDPDLDGKTPGQPGGTGGDCERCHARIVDCTSCHAPKHHAGSGSAVVGKNDGWYRFLNSSLHGHDLAGVKGIEDSDWQYTMSASDHNEYNGTNNPLGFDDNSMSNYCGGCHYMFHGAQNTDSDPVSWFCDNKSPWYLHPTHLALSQTAAGKEYHLYNTSDDATAGSFNPDVPVARNPTRLSGMAASSSQVYVAAGAAQGDQVMCLSCHRAHGSPYADMLRWDYQGMSAHNAGGATGSGCFVCHTAKDNT